MIPPVFSRPAPTGPRSTSGFIRLATVVSLAAGLVGCASSPKKAAAAPAPPAPYTRVAKPDTNTVSLEIAWRRFTPSKGTGPAIWLTGVSHIGESNYYAVLQRHLDVQSLVLFEGVGARDKKLRFDPEEQSSIQNTLATSLGLVFQLAAIDYDRAHFQNSDLTIPELQKMLTEDRDKDKESKETGGTEGGSTKAASPASPEFKELMGVMDGSSVLGMLVHMGVKFLGSSPKLQAMMKLTMIETLGRFQGDLSEAKGMPPELQKLMTVIIRGRNDVVIRDLKKHLARHRTGGPISVFYGAGHMADLEKRLVDELGYRRREEKWTTALSVNTRASGLSATELEMVHGLVQWQLEAMQSH